MASNRFRVGRFRGEGISLYAIPDSYTIHTYRLVDSFKDKHTSVTYKSP